MPESLVDIFRRAEKRKKKNKKINNNGEFDPGSG